VSQRERILVLGGQSPRLDTVLNGAEIVRAKTLAEAATLLQDSTLSIVMADSADATLVDEFRRLACSERILDAIDHGIAVLDGQFIVRYANPAFRSLCAEEPIGRHLEEAIGPFESLTPGVPPFSLAAQTKVMQARMTQTPSGRTLEIRMLPEHSMDGPRQYVVMCHDVTKIVQQQHKLDALHQAGQELADLTSDELADMTFDDRVALLKANLLQSIHELLHYDRIEIRLLNPRTGRLTPLLAEGMSPVAEMRILYARETGNGVTGLVAATGKSYLCPDTSRDPHYLEGVVGARSSLTVPLIAHDRVIGTFNVESLSADAFQPEDLQFTELFSREVATALHTLELLSAQHDVTALKSVEAVAREVALPLDELLAGANRVLSHLDQVKEPALAEQLRRISEMARLVREGIRKVGEEVCPPPTDDPALTRLRGTRVLVADADERVRKSAHILLGRYGCLVDTVSNGAEALAIAQTLPYDAMLADIRLPDMSGYEVYRQLRQARPCGRVILMTAFGYDASHSIVKARQDGLRFVLFKPFRLEQLLDALTSSDRPTPSPTSTSSPAPALRS
jgi:CheY-like chemotaxis protein/GAF domain-containing protein/PAS domain-containing protein